MIYLVSGPRKGKKLVGAREEKLNAKNASELFCELLGVGFEKRIYCCQKANASQIRYLKLRLKLAY